MDGLFTDYVKPRKFLPAVYAVNRGVGVATVSPPRSHHVRLSLCARLLAWTFASFANVCRTSYIA